MVNNKSKDYVEMLCRRISERCVGSEGNRQSSEFFRAITAFFCNSESPLSQSLLSGTLKMLKNRI